MTSPSRTPRSPSIGFCSCIRCTAASSCSSASCSSPRSFARATFTATKFRKLGEGRYAADGTLTIRGVPKPLTLPFSLAITGEVAKMNAGVALNRLAFGVGQDEWKSVETVPATVGVTISLTARRAK